MALRIDVGPGLYRPAKEYDWEEIALRWMEAEGIFDPSGEYSLDEFTFLIQRLKELRRYVDVRLLGVETESTIARYAWASFLKRHVGMHGAGVDELIDALSRAQVSVRTLQGLQGDRLRPWLTVLLGIPEDVSHQLVLQRDAHTLLQVI